MRTMTKKKRKEAIYKIYETLMDEANVWIPPRRGHVDKYVDENCFRVNGERDKEAMKKYWTVMHYWLIWFHEKTVAERPNDIIIYVLWLIEECQKNH